MSREETLLPSIIETIGSTPLVELSRLTKKVNLPGRIFAKLEYLNPGFSKKDRFARQVIEDAKLNGSLKEGQTVVELTSGNAGTGLAIVCGVLGHPFIAVMSRGNSIERARMMAALGAEVILVDQLPDSAPGKVSGGDLNLVEERTRELVKEREAFRADQFFLKGNFQAHYLHTGAEIIKQANCQIDAFCDFVGSGGTFSGCAAALKKNDIETQCFIIEPESAAVLSGQEANDESHKIQGGGYSKHDLNFLNNDHIDGYLSVSDEEAIATTRLLSKTEGIFAGFSSGANVAGAIQLLKGSLKGKTIVTCINDSGLKYLSTDLFV